MAQININEPKPRCFVCNSEYKKHFDPVQLNDRRIYFYDGKNDYWIMFDNKLYCNKCFNKVNELRQCRNSTI